VFSLPNYILADIGPRTWLGLHSSDNADDRADNTYVVFGDSDGRFEAYSLTPLLRKLLPEQSVASVTSFAWVYVARRAFDFCAASQAAAAGARGAGPAAAVARRICQCCDRCSCVVVSPMHPLPLWPPLCGPACEASQAWGGCRDGFTARVSRSGPLA
jgi:hypothetical protein